MSQNARPVLIFFDGTPLQIEQITAIAQQQAQAVVLRLRVQVDVPVGTTMQAWIDDVAARVPLVEEDRALDQDLQRLLTDIRDRAWSLYVH